VMFHFSGGCCDGSAPMCFRRGKVKWIPIPIPKTRTDAKCAPPLGVQRLLVSRTHHGAWWHHGLLFRFRARDSGACLLRRAILRGEIAQTGHVVRYILVRRRCDTTHRFQ
jgi:uncharacterized protein (DUF779 family)